jgi:hypothetical protein
MEWQIGSSRVANVTEVPREMTNVLLELQIGSSRVADITEAPREMTNWSWNGKLADQGLLT